MTDRQAFYNEIAQDYELTADEVKQAIETAINFLVLRKSLRVLIESADKETIETLKQPKTIGINVSDTIKAIDRLK